MLAVFPAVAFADIASPPPEGRTFVTHAVRVDGVDRHPGFVVVAFDAGAAVPDVAAWTGTGEPTRTLANGWNQRGGNFAAPTLRLMTAEAYAAWRKEADAAVAAQRAACERGEGCAHISRFVPRIAPPAGTLDCGVPALSLVTEGPADGPDAITSVFTLAEASATRCVLSEGPREQRKNGAALPTGARNCDHAGGAGAVGAALALLGLAVRRRRK